MTLTNALKDRVTIQVRTATLSAIGESVSWALVEIRSARVIPLDAKARAVYQQLQSYVTHRVIFRGEVSLAIGENRLLWGDKILDLVDPPQIIKNSTTVMVREA